MGNLILPPDFQRKKEGPTKSEYDGHMVRLDETINKIMTVEGYPREKAEKATLWHELVHHRVMLDRLFKHFGVAND